MEKKLTLQNHSDKSARPYIVHIDKTAKTVRINDKNVPFKLFFQLCNAITILKNVKESTKEKKFVTMSINNVLKHPELNGTKFEGRICKQNVEGRICVTAGRVYFCTNNADCDGSTAPDKFGYKYSWVYDSSVRTFTACPVSDEFAAIYKKECSPVQSLLTHLFEYKVTITKETVFVGCNSFKSDDILVIGEQIKEEETVTISKETLTNITSGISKLSDGLNDLKKSIESITTVKTEKAKPVTKSSARRDRFGRFI